MEWVETTGRSMPEALELALHELGVDERDAEVVVIAEARSGVFGIGRTAARIRVRVRPAAPRPKRPQRNRRPANGRGDGNDRQQRSRNRQPATVDMSKKDSPVAAVKRPTGQQRRRPQSERPTSTTSLSESTAIEEEDMTVEQQAEVVEAFVQGVVDRFGVTANTAVRTEDRHIFVEVTGDDLGLLIGQRGVTLDALQELARTVIQRRSDDQTARVSLDISGFRAKRAAALEEFVGRIADEVKATGVAQALEPMVASDRKIVHDTINAIDGVATTSEGVEPHRYVVVRAEQSEA